MSYTYSRMDKGRTERALDEVMEGLQARVDSEWKEGAFRSLNLVSVQTTVSKVLEKEYRESQDWNIAARDCLSTVLSKGHWIRGGLDAWNEVEEAQQVEQTVRSHMSDRASINRIASYARILPLILRARRELFRKNGPLDPEEAEQWFSAAKVEGQHAKWIEVKLRFLLPDETIPTPESMEQSLRDEPISFAQELLSCAAPNTNQSGTFTATGDISTGRSFFASGKTLHFYRPRTGRMSTLCMWADRIASLQVNATRLDSEDYGQAFCNAVHLIVRGHFADSPVFGHYHESRCRQEGECQSDRLLADQMITIEVQDLETTPTEVAAEYAAVRERHGANARGNRFDWCAEHIARMAINMRELEDYAMGDKGFYSEILRRWRSFAETRPEAEELLDRFQTPEQIRGTLRRLDDAHRRAVERDPERSGRGEIPHLFRRPRS